MIFSKSKKLYLFIATAMLLTIPTLSACSDDKSGDSLNMSDIKYVLSVSKTLDEDARLLFIDKNNQIKKDIKYKGCSINSIRYDNGEFVLHSSKLNKHYRLSKEGEFKTFSTLKSKYGEDINGLQSSFAVNSSEGLIEALNIDNSDDNLLSNIIYTNKGKQKSVTLKMEAVSNMLEYQGRIFAESFSESDLEHGITLIDKDSGKSHRIKFNGGYTSSGSKLLLLKDKIVTFGNNMLSTDKQHFSSIGLLDTSTLETMEARLEDKEILLTYLNRGRICAIVNDGYLYTFDSSLKLRDKTNIRQKKIFCNYNSTNYFIEPEDVKESQNSIYMFLKSENLDSDHIGYIEKFNKDSLKMEERIKIAIPDIRGWVGEINALYVKDAADAI